jgi:hypothetical protein
MKINTIMTMIGIIAAVGIISTISIGIHSQQAYSDACNLFFSNDTTRQTGSSCDETDQDTNIHFKK